MELAESEGAARRGKAPLRWGILGTGVIAAHFANDLALAPQSALSAVASRSPANAASFAARHGGQPFDSLQRMLEQDSIDAVYIAAPNAVHAGAAMAAIRAGKAVLVEKPLAVSSDEAEQITALAAAHGVFAMEAMWTRFLPAFGFVREQVRAGAIGEVRRIAAELAFAKPYSAVDRFFDPAQGGGALLDLGVYGISLCLDLLGRPQAIDGAWRAAPSGVDMSARVEMRFGTATATVTCGFERTGANLFIIEGAKATLVMQPPFNAARMVIKGAAGPLLSLAAGHGAGKLARALRKMARTVPLPGLERHPFAYPGHGLQFEIAAVEQALGLGLIEHPAAPLADSIETLRIIERVKAMPPKA